jgi:hypothetical protein
MRFSAKAATASLPADDGACSAATDAQHISIIISERILYVIPEKLFSGQ